MKRGVKRSERVADLIQRSLARILIEEMSDMRFRLVTLTGVTVSRDLAYAKIYVSVLLEDLEKIKEIIKALNHAANKMRYYLAKDIDLRIVPELKFVYDESTKHGFALSNLIDKAIKQTSR